jgi:hypothetical protein
VNAVLPPLLLLLVLQELRHRFAQDGSTATAFAVNPGNVRSSVWPNVPALLSWPLDIYMRIAFLNAEQVF